MFSTSNLTVPTGAAQGKYLTPGIHDNVRVLSITSDSPEGKSPFLEVTLTKAEPEDGRSYRLFMSSAAQTASQQKLIHLLVDGAGISREAVDKAGDDAKDLDGYAKALNALLKDAQPYRQKFAGEEYTSAGSVKTKSVIGFPPFAEPMSVTPTALVYNEKSAYDLKRIPTANLAAGGGDNDLPF